MKSVSCLCRFSFIHRYSQISMSQIFKVRSLCASLCALQILGSESGGKSGDSFNRFSRQVEMLLPSMSSGMLQIRILSIQARPLVSELCRHTNQALKESCQWCVAISVSSILVSGSFCQLFVLCGSCFLATSAKITIASIHQYFLSQPHFPTSCFDPVLHQVQNHPLLDFMSACRG